jgi:hypothetical protein
MISWTDARLRVVIIVQLLAMGIVRAYFGAPRRREPAEASPRDAGEPAFHQHARYDCSAKLRGNLRLSDESIACAMERIRG